MKTIIRQFATGLSLAAAAALLATTMWAQDPAAPSQAQPGDQMQSQQAATKSFAGKVAKQGDTYVLKDMESKMTYVLEGSDELKRYVGKEVTVFGSLDTSTNTIHVQKIQTPS